MLRNCTPGSKDSNKAGVFKFPLVAKSPSQRQTDQRAHCPWDKACRLAGFSDRVAHDLRRTDRRNLERAGVPRLAAMKMTGHKTESFCRRYAIVDEVMLREGGEKLAAFHRGRERAERTVIPLGRRHRPRWTPPETNRSLIRPTTSGGRRAHG